MNIQPEQACSPAYVSQFGRVECNFNGIDNKIIIKLNEVYHLIIYF